MNFKYEYDVMTSEDLKELGKKDGKVIFKNVVDNMLPLKAGLLVMGHYRWKLVTVENGMYIFSRKEKYID
jgi:hypothetical protein